MLSYICVTTRHLSVRVREYWHSKIRSAVGKHINNCHVCKEKPGGENDFKIMRACSTEYNTKIQEAFNKLISVITILAVSRINLNKKNNVLAVMAYSEEVLIELTLWLKFCVCFLPDDTQELGQNASR